MNNQHVDDFSKGEEYGELQNRTNDASLTKLERRRRIEDLLEEKKLREELAEF